MLPGCNELLGCTNLKSFMAFSVVTGGLCLLLRIRSVNLEMVREAL